MRNAKAKSSLDDRRVGSPDLFSHEVVGFRAKQFDFGARPRTKILPKSLDSQRPPTPSHCVAAAPNAPRNLLIRCGSNEGIFRRAPRRHLRVERGDAKLAAPRADRRYCALQFSRYLWVLFGAEESLFLSSPREAFSLDRANAQLAPFRLHRPKAA